MSYTNATFEKTRKTREAEAYANLKETRKRKQKRQQAHKETRREALADR